MSCDVFLSPILWRSSSQKFKVKVFQNKREIKKIKTRMSRERSLVTKIGIILSKLNNLLDKVDLDYSKKHLKIRESNGQTVTAILSYHPLLISEHMSTFRIIPPLSSYPLPLPRPCHNCYFIWFSYIKVRWENVLPEDKCSVGQTPPGRSRLHQTLQHPDLSPPLVCPVINKDNSQVSQYVRRQLTVLASPTRI